MRQCVPARGDTVGAAASARMLVGSTECKGLAGGATRDGSPEQHGFAEGVCYMLFSCAWRAGNSETCERSKRNAPLWPLPGMSTCVCATAIDRSTTPYPSRGAIAWKNGAVETSSRLCASMSAKPTSLLAGVGAIPRQSLRPPQLERDTGADVQRLCAGRVVERIDRRRSRSYNRTLQASEHR